MAMGIGYEDSAQKPKMMENVKSRYTHECTYVRRHFRTTNLRIGLVKKRLKNSNVTLG